MSTLLLFLGFTSNQWGVVGDEWFETHQRDTEGQVVGRIVQSRQAGLLSYAGLTGWVVSASGITGPEFQYQAFLQELPVADFEPYLSQTGAQAMLLGILDAALPLDPAARLQMFYGLTALLSALALALCLTWFQRELGWTVAGVTLGATLLSQWLVVFGRNLWWSIWAFYLPMLVVVHILQRGRSRERPRPIPLGLAVALAVLIKCLVNGFEYITTTLVMLLVPMIYYAIRDRWGMRRLVSCGLAAGLGSAAALLASTAILTAQIAAVQGSLLDGLDHILYVLQKRTYADPRDFPEIYEASLRANVLGVVQEYLRGRYADFNHLLASSNEWVARYLLKIRYVYLVIGFGLASGIAWLGARPVSSDGSRLRRRALIGATWFSILAPLSWFVIFKAHSNIHTHINFLVWQMPFTLFGFAVCGLVLRDLGGGLARRLRRSRAGPPGERGSD